jgi:hypothetical protein
MILRAVIYTCKSCSDQSRKRKPTFHLVMLTLKTTVLSSIRRLRHRVITIACDAWSHGGSLVSATLRWIVEQLGPFGIVVELIVDTTYFSTALHPV